MGWENSFHFHQNLSLFKIYDPISFWALCLLSEMEKPPYSCHCCKFSFNFKLMRNENFSKVSSSQAIRFHESVSNAFSFILNNFDTPFLLFASFQCHKSLPKIVGSVLLEVRLKRRIIKTEKLIGYRKEFNNGSPYCILIYLLCKYFGIEPNLNFGYFLFCNYDLKEYVTYPVLI